MIQRDGRIYQYYMGKRTTHGILDPGRESNDGAIFRLIQDQDRFIAACTASDRATFSTPPLIHQGGSLVLNVDCGGLGELSVQICDDRFHPIPGFTFDDCDRVDLNQLAHVVTFRGRHDLDRLAGRPIRLEFRMSSAKLYTFQFCRQKQ